MATALRPAGAKNYLSESWTRPVGGRASLRSAFTLIEILVVVAMLGIITVGIARIFRSVGDTVRGGKRVSNLNSYATLIERQMRKDFESMTRSGFLLIRNRNVGGMSPNFGDEPIKLTLNDKNPARFRRGDEILFFANGDFSSQRNPVHPDRSPRSTEGMIYYGHGLKRDPNDTTANFRDPVELNDGNQVAPGFNQPPALGALGPDKYAADWILARRAFLLIPPSVMGPEPVVQPQLLGEPYPAWPGTTVNPYAGGRPYEDLDRNIQISLQPAAISPFRVIANDPRYVPPSWLPGDDLIVRDGTVQLPNLACGVVDIIASSLAETRNVVIDAQPMTNTTPPQTLSFPFDLNADTDPMNALPFGGDHGQSGAVYEIDTNPAMANSTTKRQHFWMRQALPADSDMGRRVRVEPSTPDWTGSIRAAGGTPYDKDYKRTDQEMLTASNFVPHCTEFIVEYSFGKVYPANFSNALLRGQMIWHGLKRNVDLNGDGMTATGGSETVALPYGDPLFPRDPVSPLLGIDAYRYPYQRTDGTVGYRIVNKDVIGEHSPFGGATNTPEYAYFGFTDPTWRMPSHYTDANNNGQWDAGESFVDANGNRMQDVAGTPPDFVPEPTLGNGDQWYDPSIAGEKRATNEPDTVPWPWPKLIRVTMSLVDPLDPLNEQTFQFTFEVPPAPEGKQF